MAPKRTKTAEPVSEEGSVTTHQEVVAPPSTDGTVEVAELVTSAETTLGLMPDTRIIEYVKKYRMIEPFVPELVRQVDGKRVLSYGLSSYGYDLRLAEPLALIEPVEAYIDPKQGDVSLQQRFLERTEGFDYILIPAKGFVLARSVEYLRIPPNVLGLVIGKSTYARAGLLVNATACEPGWEGHLTIELVNTTNRPLAVYPGEGICQIVFFEASPCSTTYADRGGKYQGQRGITLPRV